MCKKLSSQAIQTAFSQVQGWALLNNNQVIQKSFEFADFNQAWGFMSRSALAAEQMNHHPEWTNIYNRVDVRLTTHDVKGLSQRDFDLAKAMDRFAAAISSSSPQ